MTETTKTILSVILVLIILICIGIIAIQRKESAREKRAQAQLSKMVKGEMSKADAEKVKDVFGKDLMMTKIDRHGNAYDMDGNFICGYEGLPDFIKDDLKTKGFDIPKVRANDFIKGDKSPFLAGLFDQMPPQIITDAYSEISDTTLYILIEHRVEEYCKEHNSDVDPIRIEMIADGLTDDCIADVKGMMTQRKSKEEWDELIERKVNNPDQ